MEQLMHEVDRRLLADTLRKHAPDPQSLEQFLRAIDVDSRRLDEGVGRHMSAVVLALQSGRLANLVARAYEISGRCVKVWGVAQVLGMNSLEEPLAIRCLRACYPNRFGLLEDLCAVGDGELMHRPLAGTEQDFEALLARLARSGRADAVLVLNGEQALLRGNVDSTHLMLLQDIASTQTPHAVLGDAWDRRTADQQARLQACWAVWSGSEAAPDPDGSPSCRTRGEFVQMGYFDILCTRFDTYTECRIAVLAVAGGQDLWPPMFEGCDSRDFWLHVLDRFERGAAGVPKDTFRALLAHLAKKLPGEAKLDPFR